MDHKKIRNKSKNLFSFDFSLFFLHIPFFFRTFAADFGMNFVYKQIYGKIDHYE